MSWFVISFLPSRYCLVSAYISPGLGEKVFIIVQNDRREEVGKLRRFVDHFVQGHVLWAREGEFCTFLAIGMWDRCSKLQQSVFCLLYTVNCTLYTVHPAPECPLGLL